MTDIDMRAASERLSEGIERAKPRLEAAMDEFRERGYRPAPRKRRVLRNSLARQVEQRRIERECSRDPLDGLIHSHL